MKSIVSLAVLVTLSSPALGVSVWSQCGLSIGIGWSGATNCDSGSTCIVVNPYYSQCQPGSATATTSVPSTTVTTTAGAPGPSGCTTSGTRTKFKFFGVNESGAEFGNNVIPGTLGTDYTFPAPSSIDYFVGKGMNFFRFPFLMERLVPPATGLTGALNAAYLGNMTSTVNYITSKGAFVALDPHNFMSYNGAQITSTANFQTFWKNLATQFKSNPNVIFDVMNEPNGIPATTVAALNQAAINGIRSAGATSQLILVEGTSWTGAWTWTSSGNAAAFTGIKDPNNNFAIQMHQYLDTDGSGTNPACVSSTIGVERLTDATNWLKANNLRGFLGEMGAGSNAACIAAIQGALCMMQQSAVWIGFSWWAAGPWWADYYQSMEPPNGASIAQVLPQALMPFL
ncbi:endoglucanase [Mycena floridula]|nr:endoglucanase [Mycena floridula]